MQPRLLRWRSEWAGELPISDYRFERNWSLEIQMIKNGLQKLAIGNWQSAVLLAICVLAVSCRRDMQDQPKMKPFRTSTFFSDGLSARQPVEGTIPRGYLRTPRPFRQARSRPRMHRVDKTLIPMTSKLFRFRLLKKLFAVVRSDSTSSVRYATERRDTETAWSFVVAFDEPLHFTTTVCAPHRLVTSSTL